MGKRKNKIGGFNANDLKIDEDIGNAIKLARESFNYTCTPCIYYDGKSAEEAFKDNDILMMFIHMQDKHKIKAPFKMTGLRENTPYSKYLQHLRGSQPPMIFKYIDVNGVEHRSYLPLLDIPAPTEDEISFFAMNTQMENQRINITVVSKVVDTSNYQIYSLPEMVSNECEECPHCFNQEEQKIINKVPLTGKNITQDLIMTFKCDINLCTGIKTTYKDHIIKWDDKLMDMCLEQQEEVEEVEEVEELE